MLQKVNICGVDTAGLPKLSHKENEELMRRLKSGDKAARDRFIIGNMRLVLSLVKRFWAKNANADDVFQAGCVGLIKAIDGFDLSFNVKFSTYAVPMILGEIKRYLRDGNSLRVSRSIRDAAYRILKVRESLEERDEEATIERIAEVMQVQQREVVYALDGARRLKGRHRPTCRARTQDPHPALLRGQDADGDLRGSGHFAGAGLPPRKKRHRHPPQGDRLNVRIFLASFRSISQRHSEE